MTYKLLKKIDEYIQSKIDKQTENISKDIQKKIEKLVKEESYSWLPHGACWLCAHPVSREGGYSVWRGRMFCGEDCTRKFATLISAPDENYKYLFGDPIEIIKHL